VLDFIENIDVDLMVEGVVEGVMESIP